MSYTSTEVELQSESIQPSPSYLSSGRIVAAAMIAASPILTACGAPAVDYATRPVSPEETEALIRFAFPRPSLARRPTESGREALARDGGTLVEFNHEGTAVKIVLQNGISFIPSESQLKVVWDFIRDRADGILPGRFSPVDELNMMVINDEGHYKLGLTGVRLNNPGVADSYVNLTYDEEYQNLSFWAEYCQGLMFGASNSAKKEVSQEYICNQFSIAMYAIQKDMTYEDYSKIATRDGIVINTPIHLDPYERGAYEYLKQIISGEKGSKVYDKAVREYVALMHMKQHGRMSSAKADTFDRLKEYLEDIPNLGSDPVVIERYIRWFMVGVVV